MNQADPTRRAPGPTRSNPPTDADGMPVDRWVETPSGGLFFINSLLVFPYVMVLVPLLTRLFVRGVMGGLQSQSAIVDTFPLLAGHLAPRYGWLAVVPIVLVVRNLRMETRSGPRMILWVFLVAHLLVLGWTLTGWMGLHAFALPGGLPGS